VSVRNCRSLRLLWVAFLFAALCSLALAHAQQSGRSYRLGFLTPYAVPPGDVGEENREAYKTFEQTLRERGYIRGENLTLTYRSTGGRDELLGTLVEEFLREKVDVLLTLGTPATLAVQRATKSTPIVMVTVLDPVHSGFVASLSRPGGNITGSSELSEELAPKRLELLKEALPKTVRVAVLFDPTHPANALDLKRTEAAGKTFGLKVRGFAAHDAAEIEQTFVAMQPWHPDALVVLTSYSAFTHLSRIIAGAKKRKLPTIYGTWQGAKSGALLSYGPDIPDQYRHAALFVDRILKGANPADLPVEQPTNFQLAINLTTAKALGITIPQSLLVRANEVLE